MNSFIKNPTYRNYIEIAKALKALGYTDYTIEHFYIDGEIRLNHATVRIARHMQMGLCLHDHVIGIYDFDKHTFVD